MVDITFRPGMLRAFVILLLVFVAGKVFSQNKDLESEKSIYQNFKTELTWKAKVKVGTMLVVGESKRGIRRVVPVTGGTFSGPKIKGEVLPGGDDWQLVRPDGDTELDARYLLKTDDGFVIQIRNQALMHTLVSEEGGLVYVKSVVDVEAPAGSPYDYLNHSIFLGTLEIPVLEASEDPYVIIGVYRVL
ncbi:DUF3237 domain-containing protein [Mangrovibacterium marinum]|uniref:UPF0311 protein C8N47_1255 n=1 Tax=Mangrovibacterium marinum TaxID=1639118 RepID=A0A2T5BXQ6_9BACT|nr:DUF3237 domain-containing protein [Mangrovibacterium marinum]PTN05908.1 uncharacterized protein DUF3237 [Mangrovibacterium marinum]